MFWSCRTGGAVGVAVLVSVVLLPQDWAAEPLPERLTLREAIDESFARSPVLQSRRTEVEQNQARLLTAKTHPFNPAVEVEAARRSNGGSTTDRGIRLSQEVQIGGQRRRRVAAASADLEASRAGLVREERLLEARVRAAFVEALRARELRDVEAANAELARSLAEVARKRFESGAVAQMEVNLARVQVGRAERDLTLAGGAYEVALSALAEVVGIDPSRPPEVDGQLALVSRRNSPLEELLSTAELERADLQSFRTATEAARARIELARRRAVPNLEFQAFYGREDGTDRLRGGGVMMRIPIFNRNQGGIAETRAVHRQAIADAAATEIRVRQEVAASLARYRASAEASEHLQRQVLGTLEDNLQLLQRSFEAGKTGWADVLVFRREFVEVRRDYIETVTDALLAGIELDLASGVAPTVTDKELQP